MTAALKGTGRLRTAADFRRVSSGGRHSHTRNLALAFLANTTGEIRLGINVSVHTARSAVRRNRLKRVIREGIRSRVEGLLPGYDLVISVLNDPGPGEGSILRAEIKELFEKCRLWRIMTD